MILEIHLDAARADDWSPLVRAATPSMRTAAAELGASSTTLDDAIQEAWLRILRRSPLPDLGPGQTLNYCRLAARSALIDIHRRQRTMKRWPPGGFESLDAPDAIEAADPSPGPDELHEARETIGSALAEADHDRSLVTAVLVDGFTQREAGAIFGLSEQAVGRRIIRFRNLWRKH